jgi:hypothetical protein
MLKLARMSRRRDRRRRNTDLRWALGIVAGFLVYVFVLTSATGPLVRALWAVSGESPRLYAAGLAALVGLPGLLLTVPRLRAPDRPLVRALTRRRELRRARSTHGLTDALGACAFLLAQAPLPAPWGPSGKAATIANITQRAEVVELSRAFSTASLVVVAIGVGAAVLAQVYRHAAAYRVIAVLLAVAAPVVAWVWLDQFCID